MGCGRFCAIIDPPPSVLPNPVSPTLFLTDRLRVRELAPGDEPLLLALHGDPAVARWMGDGTPLTPEMCLAWVRVSMHNYTHQGYGYCAVFERAGGAFVGGCGLIHPPGEPRRPVEIVYALRPPFWGRGYAREMVSAMLTWGAQERGLRQVWATAMPDNTASARVLAASGLRWQHTRPDADGEPTATWLWEAPAQAPSSSEAPPSGQAAPGSSPNPA